MKSPVNHKKLVGWGALRLQRLIGMEGRCEVCGKKITYDEARGHHIVGRNLGFDTKDFIEVRCLKCENESHKKKEGNIPYDERPEIIKDIYRKGKVSLFNGLHKPDSVSLPDYSKGKRQSIGLFGSGSQGDKCVFSYSSKLARKIARRAQRKGGLPSEDGEP